MDWQLANHLLENDKSMETSVLDSSANINENDSYCNIRLFHYRDVRLHLQRRN
jgi:hypothetical protein